MNPILAAVALAIVAGTIIAVSVRDPRVVVLAVTLVLVLSPALADPMAMPSGLAARSLGAILSGYLLWMATRIRPAAGEAPVLTEGSRIGWPAEVLVGAAAAVTGFAAHGLGAPAVGPALATAAGFGVAALTVAPMLTGRDVIRIGTGLILLLDAATLVRVALGGTPGPLEHLLTAGLFVTVAGAVAAIGRAARADGSDGFSVTPDVRPRRRHEPDAHPLAERPARSR